MATAKTPIKDILNPQLFPHNVRVIGHILPILESYKIETAEQLSTYNKFALKVGGNTSKRGLTNNSPLTNTQYEFLRKCLKSKGMDFAQEISLKKTTPYQIVGESNVKDYLLQTLKNQTQPNQYLSSGIIAERAIDRLEGLTGEWRFFDLVFHNHHVISLLEKLTKEGKVEKVLGNTTAFYRAK